MGDTAKDKGKTKIEDLSGKGKVKDETADAVKGGVLSAEPGDGTTWSRQDIGERAGPSSVSDSAELPRTSIKPGGGLL